MMEAATSPSIKVTKTVKNHDFGNSRFKSADLTEQSALPVATLGLQLG